MENYDYFKTEDKINIICYDRFGDEISEHNIIKGETVFAKKIVGENSRYKVAMFDGYICNPIGTNCNRESVVKKMFSYKEVSQELFDKYIYFLKNKKYDSLHIINREIFNG
jgi:hypothetical protein